jgi:hypothetical protein
MLDHQTIYTALGLVRYVVWMDSLARRNGRVRLIIVRTSTRILKIVVAQELRGISETKRKLVEPPEQRVAQNLREQKNSPLRTPSFLDR